MPPIISFAETTQALLRGEKTVTRREWKDSYAQRFKAGDLLDAWDRSPRTGNGKKVATIRLSADPYKEPLHKMPHSDLKAEGGLWDSREEFIEYFGGDPELEVWVLRFEVDSWSI